jgi:plasmid stability protein
MATLTIRNLDDKVKRALQIRAARNGRSMEAEVRALIEISVESDLEKPIELPDPELLAAIHNLFKPLSETGLKKPPQSVPASDVEIRRQA